VHPRRHIGLVWLAAAALAAAGCTSSGSAAPPHPPGPLVYLAAGASHQLGVDNIDLYATSAAGGVARDVTHTAGAESDSAWTADGAQVVFVRTTASGSTNGHVVLHTDVYTMTAATGRSRLILRCPTVCGDDDFAWSPDGRQIAFVSDSDNPRDVAASALRVMNADGGDLHTVCATPRCGQGLGGPAWSPDGSRLVFSNQAVGDFIGLGIPDSAIWVADPDGSGVRKLTQPGCNPQRSTIRDCFFDSAPAWSPDGRSIAFSRLLSRRTRAPRTQIELMAADGTHMRVLATCRGDVCNQEMAPAWSPDGRLVAYAPGVERDPSIDIVSLSGPAHAIRACMGARCVTPSGLTWSPDGRRLAFTSSGLPTAAFTIDADGRHMRRIARSVNCCLAWLPRTPLRAAAPAARPAPGPGAPFPSGTISFTSDRTHPGDDDAQQVYLLHMAAGHARVTRLVQHPEWDFQASWSPDGRQLVTAGVRPGANTALFVLNADGTGERRLVVGDHGVVEPAWSPDGRRIAYVGDTGLWLIGADGRGAHSILSGFAENPAWSPNGRTIAVARGKQEAIWLLAPDGSGLRRLTRLPGSQTDPAWSPDGRRLAFWWSTGAGSSLYLIDADGSGLRRVTTRPIAPGAAAWSPDGRWLAFVTSFGYQHSQIDAVDLRSGVVVRLLSLAGEASDLAWRPTAAGK
jgi:Tol biopolymer transport system component